MMFYFVVLDVMFCFFNIFSVRALELSGVRCQTIMSQKLDVFSNSLFCIFLVRAMKLPGVRSQTMIHRQIIRTVFLTSQEKNTCTYWMVYAVASFGRLLRGQRVFCKF